MSRRHLSALAVASVALLTFGVGCSGSDSSDAAGSDAKTTTTAKGSEDSPDTTEGDGDASTSDGGDLKLTGEFCDRARQLEANEDLFAGNTTDTSPEGQLAAAISSYRIIETVYEQLKDGAPDEVADALEVLAEASSGDYDKVKDVETIEELRALQPKLAQSTQSEEFRDATKAMQAYLEESCGIGG